MSKFKTQEQIDFIKNILEADFLIIDDLGTECMNSLKITELFNIINTRLLNLDSKVTKTLISTNLSLEQVFKVYEERIGSRVAGFYDIFFFFGEDLRLNKYKK
ncbi:DNA replication protein DnaC [compost metagenome]